MKITWVRWLLGVFALVLVGCSTADNEMAGGNIQAINHTLSNINWLSVNGYRADGGGGRSCCIIMPTKWRPGLKAHIEWEVDPEPFAKIKRKLLGMGSMKMRGLRMKRILNVTAPKWIFQSGREWSHVILKCIFSPVTR